MSDSRRRWRFGTSLAFAGAALLAAACTPEMGSQLGNAVGTMGGSYLTRGGMPSGAVGDITATVGGLIGSEIARYLNNQERAQAETAARASINSESIGPGSTRTWTSQTNPGVSGGSTVVAQKTAADGRACRTQRNFVNVKGKDVEQSETLCRDPKTGAWTTTA